VKIVGIIEARMKSTRLPGKVLKTIGNYNSIEHIVRRLQKVTDISDICVATTVDESDDRIAEFAQMIGVRIFRGSENDVLLRVLEAADSLSAEVIIEITADCPFVDPQMVKDFLKIFLTGDFEYVSNNVIPTFADGFDIQIFRTETLRRSSYFAKSRAEREHVTMHIRQNPGVFRICNIEAPHDLRHPNLSVTLDTEEDLDVLLKISDHFGPNYFPNHIEITNYLLSNPEISKINSAITRKGFGE
jgi:spore coat polysaccharide biosynthesis protein SpsF